MSQEENTSKSNALKKSRVVKSTRINRRKDGLSLLGLGAAPSSRGKKGEGGVDGGGLTPLT